MGDFAKLLNDKMKKAAEATRVPETAEGKGRRSDSAPRTAPDTEPEPVEIPPAPKPAPVAPDSRRKVKPEPVRSGSNTNRVTVNLFAADRRALAIIKELLDNAGYDFTNRSDSIKIALRLAAKASKEELATLLLEVRGEDRRFSGNE